MTKRAAMADSGAEKMARDCERCGRQALSLIAGRVAKFSAPGFVDIFRCAACGHVSQHDKPAEPPRA